VVIRQLQQLGLPRDAFASNHFAGFTLVTVELSRKLWGQIQSDRKKTPGEDPNRNLEFSF
jgi:hypothetical protein